MSQDEEQSFVDATAESLLPRFWDEFLPITERAFGVWTHPDGAVEWARDSWKVLIEAGLVPQQRDCRDNAVALATLLALASVYRDFCMAAFDEVSYVVDLAYAADDASLGGVPELAVARLVGELDIETDDEYDEILDMLEGLIRWRRADVAAALVAHLGPDELFRQLWRTCLSPNVFESDDGEPSDESEKEAILSEPWTIGIGTPGPAYAWISEGCPMLGT